MATSRRARRPVPGAVKEAIERRGLMGAYRLRTNC